MVRGSKDVALVLKLNFAWTWARLMPDDGSQVLNNGKAYFQGKPPNCNVLWDMRIREFLDSSTRLLKRFLDTHYNCEAELIKNISIKFNYYILLDC